MVVGLTGLAGPSRAARKAAYGSGHEGTPAPIMAKTLGYTEEYFLLNSFMRSIFRGASVKASPEEGSYSSDM